ncbi:unnamed protein product [Rhizophagus irregularis]|nr:unnamed protein product [Rhizophagus irregularis]
METFRPDVVVEWIPYGNLQNIKYLTKGGFSEIYIAVWNGGGYDEWDAMKQQLTRFGNQVVILKRLENVESADQSWFEEAKSHFTIKEQEAFHSKSYDDFYIPDSINDFAKSSSSKNNSMSKKMSSIFKVNNADSQLYEKFEKLQVKNDFQEDYNNNKETMKHHSYIDDEDEVHNNPNLHSEEQDELEIPES